MKSLVCIALLFCAISRGATNKVQSSSYQEALRIYGASRPYQKAVAELLTREATSLAQQLGIAEVISTNPEEVGPPESGINGTSATDNYYFDFLQGRLREVRWADWLRKLNPPVTDMLEFAEGPSLINKDTALQLARTWLTNVGIDVAALEKKSLPSVFHIPANSARETPPGQPRPMRPQFIVTWPGPPQTIAGRTMPPRPGHGLVAVEILGTTKQLIRLSVEDSTLWTRPKLELTNAESLLGPDPTPAELMARIITPGVFETIEKHDSIEVYLLTSRGKDFKQPKKDRLGPLKLEPALAKALSNALLDVESYNSFNAAKGCITDDGARLVIKHRDDEVHIGFCFECDMLTLRAGSYRKILNFENGHNRFAELLQQIFPNDAVLRSIPRKPKT